MVPKPARPAYVQFFPTLRCNRSCGFCFSRSIPAADDVRPEEFARMLDALLAAGVTTLDLLGGEPTLHPGLDSLAAALAARGMRTTLSTNGHGDLAALERLEERFGPETLRVGVSLNGAEIPERLRSYVARRRPMVKSVCTPSWSLAPAAAEHLGRPDAEFFLLYMDALTPGDLAGSLSFPAYFDRLADLRSRHPRAEGVSCGGFVPDLGRNPELSRVRCPAGTTKLSVLPDGSVYPCYLLFARPEFRLGNLLRDPFERIWEHPALAFFRTFEGTACPRTGCAHHAACHGGCPAVSLAITGDLRAPDPRCVPRGPAAADVTFPAVPEGPKRA